MVDEELNLPGGSFGYGDLPGMEEFDEGEVENANDEESGPGIGVVSEPTIAPTQVPPKKRGRKEKIPPFTWKDELVFLLIDRWQEEAVLYNVKDKDYHDKNKRNNALQRITAADEWFPKYVF